MKTSESSLGTPEHIAIAIAYALGWLTGLVVLLVEKHNDTVRYHAAQSVVIFGAITLVNLLIPIFPFSSLNLLFLNLLSLVTLIAWIALIVTALSKKPLTIEPIRSYAEQLQTAIKS